MANVVTNFEMPNGETVMIKDALNKEYPTAVTRSLKGGTSLWCGDSYTYGTGASDHHAGDTRRFSSLVCAALGMEEINIAVGSTGFVDPGSSGQNSPFQTQLNNWYNANQNRAADIDVVFISGGYNDVFYDNATYSATLTSVRNIIKYTAEKFPNAFIVLTPMMWRGWGLTVKAKNLYSAIVQGCMTAEHNERVLLLRDAWSWTFNQECCADDHIHPNDVGHARIASAILQGLNGRGTDYLSWNSLVAAEGTTFYNTAFVLRKGMLCTLDPFFAYFEVASGANKVIATLAKNACPVSNVYGSIYSGNKYAGVYCITESGNVYVFNTTSSTLKSAYFTPATWQLYGLEY